jgi:hypothetical protein
LSIRMQNFYHVKTPLLLKFKKPQPINYSFGIPWESNCTKACGSTGGLIRYP